MDPELFIRTWPQLYHMAHHQALPSIRRHGLLCTTSLLDLFEVPGHERLNIESKMRRTSITINHPLHGKAVIRDQRAMMNDERLKQALGGSCSTRQFHNLLNSKVFFWVSSDRLQVLRNAVLYALEPQLVIILDSQKVVRAYSDRITLCPMNSGSCKPMAFPRTPKIFLPIKDYDFDHWREKKGSRKKAVVECAVQGGISDIERFLVNAEIVGG